MRKFPTAQGQFADHAAGFKTNVGGAEIGRADRTERFLQGAADLSAVGKIGGLVQQLALGRHVRGLEHGADEHELPDESRALALEQVEIDRLRVFHDGPDGALRGSKQFRWVGERGLPKPRHCEEVCRRGHPRGSEGEVSPGEEACVV